MKTHSIAEYDIPVTYVFENELLAALLDNPAYITEARKRIDTESFADEKNRKFWHILTDMDSEGAEISLTTVYPKADAQHFQNCILPHCVGTLPPTEIFEKINAAWTATAKRKAYFASVELLQLASGDGKVQDIYNIMHEYTEKIGAAESGDDTIKVSQAVNEYAATLEKRQKDAESGKRLRIPTSFKTLNFATYGGFAPGNLVILAARPSVGKTAIMLQMAREAALNNFPALVFSLEMTNNELVQRMLTAVSGIEPYALANGKVDWQDFDSAVGKFADAPLWFNDKAGSLDELITKITAASRQGNCRIAFIDYLGLISYRDNGRSLYQQVTETTKRLKRLAKDCDIPIVLLCQLNRDMSKEGREPQLHDLRDSGSIEQDSDIVLMVSRDLDPEKDYRNLKIFIRKNRQGELATLDVVADNFMGNFTERV